MAEIKDLELQSPAQMAGLLSGDTILSINGNPINDEIDVTFYSQAPVLNFVIKRRGKTLEKTIEKDEYAPAGFTLEPFKIKQCANRCVFCFVSQLPKGLRKTLYIKDEDFRLSFQYGSYLTLSNLTPDDKKRIITQKLSPLYVSIHSTNDEIRRHMLRNPNAAPILKEIQFLVKNKIKIHTQIVLCPGLNDGADLVKTINDLYKLYPYVNTIAVIPVGLTALGNKKLRPVTKQDAEDALTIIEKAQKKFSKKHGDYIVYGADELYIKAGINFPPLKNYGELHQIENGIGMVAQFMEKARRFRKHITPSISRIFAITGVSFYPYLNKFAGRLRDKYGFNITIIPVRNLFFGESVSVTGLISGRDILRSLMGKVNEDDILLIPDVTLRNGEDIFLDDISFDFIGETLKVKTVLIESSFEGLINALINLNDNISN
jgi:putative radical SAM enzyme (TIGR03279 family)